MCFLGREKKNVGFPGEDETEAGRIHLRLLGANMV